MVHAYGTNEEQVNNYEVDINRTRFTIRWIMEIQSMERW